MPLIPRVDCLLFITIFILHSRYYNNWCGKGDLEYLQDGLCAKIFPNVVDRDWSCGVLPIDTPPSKEDGYQPDTLLGDVAVDTEILGGLITDTDVNLCLILTKRVKGASSAAGETLYNRYLCAGNRSSLVPYETWSRCSTLHIFFYFSLGCFVTRGFESCCILQLQGVRDGQRRRPPALQ